MRLKIAMAACVLARDKGLTAYWMSFCNLMLCYIVFNH